MDEGHLLPSEGVHLWWQAFVAPEVETRTY